MVSSVAFVCAYVCTYARIYAVCMYVLRTYTLYTYIHAYTGRITYLQSVINIFLYERLGSADIILRNNGNCVPAR